jgi:hypothetical protein
MAPRSALAVGFEGGVSGGAVRDREAEEGAGSSAIAGGTEGVWPQALAPRSHSHGIVEGPGGSAAVARGGGRRRRGSSGRGFFDPCQEPWRESGSWDASRLRVHDFRDLYPVPKEQ